MEYSENWDGVQDIQNQLVEKYAKNYDEACQKGFDFDDCFDPCNGGWEYDLDELKDDIAAWLEENNL